MENIIAAVKAIQDFELMGVYMKIALLYSSSVMKLTFCFSTLNQKCINAKIGAHIPLHTLASAISQLFICKYARV